MTPKLATTLFIAGTLLAPLATYAAGTNDARTGAATSAPTASHDAAATSRSGAATGTESVKESMEDAAITTKVKGAFAKDSDVSALKIHVDTDRGVVRLSGNAKTRAEADKAVQIARDTKGVLSVTNDITVGAADSAAMKSPGADDSTMSKRSGTSTSPTSKY